MFTKTRNLNEFKQAAADLTLGLKPVPDRATVVGLYGDLGSGKTTFVQAAAKALGVSERIASPTFLIMKSYSLLDSRFSILVHIDAYRLKNSGDLRHLRLNELLADPQNLIFVEWADCVAEILPKDHIKLFLKFADKNIRSIAAG